MRPMFGWFIALVSVTATAHAEPTRSQAAGEVTTAFTSNLFQEQNRRLGDFDSKNGPGERFDGMDGPSDLRTRLAVEGGVRHKLGKKRRAEALVTAEYNVHALNAIANYGRIGVEGSYDLSRATGLSLELGVEPKRFFKNAAASIDLAGNKVFEPARATSFEASLEAMHERGPWRAGAEYELLIRRYAAPHGNRDRDGHDVTLSLGHAIGERWIVGGRVGGGIGRSPDGLELGVMVDRSYWQAGAGAFAEADLPGHWTFESELGLRHREYVSDQPADDAHYGRVDNRFELEAAAARGFGDHIELLLEAGWSEELSNRSDPTLTADEAGYRELVIGVGVRASL
jgi:hypothetical protein